MYKEGGVVFVTQVGTTRMHLLCVDSWATLQQVWAIWLCYDCFFDSFMIMFDFLGNLNVPSFSVQELDSYDLLFEVELDR